MSVLSDIWNGVSGKSAAEASKQAAADTYAKQQSAISQLLDYGKTLPGKYAELYQPYTSAGSSALTQLMAGLGLGGDQGAFTRAYQSLPGYQSGLATGQQAAERGLQAGGGLNSGKALKALYRYGSDYENQRVGDYLSRLAGVAGQGLTATGGAAGGLGAQTALQGQAFGGQMNAAGTIGQGDVAAETAKQQGLTNLLSVGSNLLGSYLGGNKAKPVGSTGPSGWSLPVPWG